MIPHTDLSRLEVVFTHIDDQGANYNFAVDRMFAWCKKTYKEVFTVDLDIAFAYYSMEARGIEKHRLYRLPEAALKVPMLNIEWGDAGEHLLVDGHHRYVRACMLGKKTGRTFILDKTEWPQFQIEGLPDDTASRLRASFSGIR